MTADQADAQVNPMSADLQAILTACGAWRDVLYFVEVRASGHDFHYPPRVHAVTGTGVESDYDDRHS